VQDEIRRRTTHGKQPGGADPYSVKLICSECGSHYGRKSWHAASKYARYIWRCNHKYDGDIACSTPHVYEHMIQQGFIEAFNSIAVDKEQFRQDYQAIVDYLSDTAALDKTIAAAQADCDVTMGLLKKMVDENTQAAQDQAAFSDRYNALTAKFDTAKERLQEATEEKQSRMARKARVVWFLQELEQQKQVLDCWDEELFLNIVETVNVYHGGEASFVFRDGSEVTVILKDK
ncbi:zinc ribbon domain-containing protein, partial [Eubacteriales bacterium OttesenSCG-928-A19]|nr:zinc ribbon domain-containing protein [Eubacteriales bacterium OttesenSCG-928-A19]